MKEFGSDGDEAFTRETLRDIADVRVDAEGFLKDEQAGE